jgi:hypothetical protein
MTADEGAGAALFGDPVPAGFARRVHRVAPGRELELDACDAIAVVEEGVVELECRSGARRRFGRGAMLPLARVAHVRSVGRSPLVLVAVAREMSDEFLRASGSHVDC